MTVKVEGWKFACVLDEENPEANWRVRLDRVAHHLASETQGQIGENGIECFLEAELRDVSARLHYHARNGIAYVPHARSVDPHANDPFVGLFMSEFPDECSAWVNFEEAANGLLAWNPFSKHSFDIAIGLLSRERSGILCIADED
jgi:hypothetical protein